MSASGGDAARPTIPRQRTRDFPVESVRTAGAVTRPAPNRPGHGGRPRSWRAGQGGQLGQDGRGSRSGPGGRGGHGGYDRAAPALPGHRAGSRLVPIPTSRPRPGAGTGRWLAVLRLATGALCVWILVEDALASRYPAGIAPNPVGWVGESGWFRFAVLAGLAVVATAVLLGVCLRGAALVGGALVLGVAGSGGWVVFGLLAVVALMVCAGTSAGDVWGFGRAWVNHPVVRRNPWLR